MIVSALPLWIIIAMALVITMVYYFRYKDKAKWMGHPLAILLIFAIHFFFFAWGVVIFLATELIRAMANKRAKEKYEGK